MTRIRSKLYLTTETVFYITLIVAALTIVSIWFFGLGAHRSIYNNSLLSTSVLSVIFFLFLAIGLYKGIKLKDNLGRIVNTPDISKILKSINFSNGLNILEVGQGMEGCILSVLLWLLVSVLIVVFVWVFGVVFWTAITVFIAMLYWIFFRALRIVFKNSKK